MPRVFIRPDSPYDNAPLPNDKKYTNITVLEARPPKAIELDDDANYFIDSMNLLSQDIDGVVAGNIPGSDNPNNAGNFLTTDGAGTVSFIEITGNYFDDGSIPGRKILAQSIGTLQMQDGAIGENQLQNNSVTDGKIDDDAVGAGSIKNGAISTLKLADLAVTTGKMTDGAVTTQKIPDGAITNPKLGALAVTADKMAPNSVPTEKIPDSAITNQKLGALAVTADKIALKTITFGEISDSFSATKAQQQAANSSSVFVSPATQQYHPSAASFWVNLNGANGNILDSYNVYNVVMNSQGNFTISFTNNFASSNYAVMITVQRSSGITAGQPVSTIVIQQSASSVRILVYQAGATPISTDDVYVVGFGNLA